MPLSSLQPSISDVLTDPSLSSALPRTAIVALWHGDRIEAITLVRQEQKIGLREATELVDTYLRSQPTLTHRIREAHADAREGLRRWLIFLFIGGIGLAYFLT